MTNWNKEELLAYILIWGANADLEENVDEVQMILAKIDPTTYKKMHREFEKDNDVKVIEKISDTFKRLKYSSEEIDSVFNDMKDLFKADEHLDAIEETLGRGLRRIIA